MTSGIETAAGHGRNSKLHQLWLAPLLAFAGLAILLFIGSENWLYPLPVFQATYQMIPVTTPPLRGSIELPNTVRLGGHLRVNALLQSLDTSAQPQQVALLLDDKPVAEIGIPEIASQTSNGSSTRPRNWQIDFVITNTPSGEHSVALLALVTGHGLIKIAETTIVVQQ